MFCLIISRENDAHCSGFGVQSRAANALPSLGPVRFLAGRQVLNLLQPIQAARGLHDWPHEHPTN